MRGSHKADLTGDSPGAPPAPKKGRRHSSWAILSIWAIAALAAIGMVPAFATAAVAAPPSPAHGIAPGAVYVSSAENDVLYTATDRTVWVKNLDNGSLVRISNGLLISAPSAIYNGSTVIVFGEGTDHQLWWTLRLATGGYANWAPLGGALTAQPGAVFTGAYSGGIPPSYSVFVRGTDGAVYELDHTSGGWPSSFFRVGGRLLAGTGPTAAFVTTPASPSSFSYLAAVGTNRALYVAALGLYGFTSAGGQTTASPALTSYFTSGAGGTFTVVAFVRGTNNAGYYNEVESFPGAAGTPSWHPIGGRLNSGLAATTAPLTGTSYVYALGTDNQVYEKTANLTTVPVTFSPTWSKVTG